MAVDPKYFVVNSWTDIFKGLESCNIKSVEIDGNDFYVTCHQGTSVKIRNAVPAYRSHLLSVLYAEVQGYPYADFLEATGKLTVEQLNNLIEEVRGLPEEEKYAALDVIPCSDIPSRLASMVEVRNNRVNLNRLIEEKRMEDQLMNEEDIYQGLFERGKRLKL